MKITKETNIAELLKTHPETASVFREYGMQCVGCIAVAFDTIEQGATSHGIDGETIETMIENLNVVVAEDAELEKNVVKLENKEITESEQGSSND
ncbi:MAG TPA: DUF1858 domain-containing protein [candidate division WWE3 bacterium]|uniref:DUF1858 domain-containing protein n=1 Tax=candidate division WWE3 bacterium TaxID=2053526 RepID=A0A7C1DID2_UNCKA|nr:DUF1858 domain-containing protein [candidate division WWE3 bacterium]